MGNLDSPRSGCPTSTRQRPAATRTMTVGRRLASLRQRVVRTAVGATLAGTLLHVPLPLRADGPCGHLVLGRAPETLDAIRGALAGHRVVALGESEHGGREFHDFA